MATLTAIWAGIKLIFTSGVLWKTLLTGIASKLLVVVTNKEVQNYALMLVISLHMNSEMTSLQKAKAFNTQMIAYLKEKKIISSTGIINFLRELAYQSMTVIMANNELTSTAASLGAKAYQPTEEDLKV